MFTNTGGKVAEIWKLNNSQGCNQFIFSFHFSWRLTLQKCVLDSFHYSYRNHSPAKLLNDVLHSAYWLDRTGSKITALRRNIIFSAGSAANGLWGGVKFSDDLTVCLQTVQCQFKAFQTLQGGAFSRTTKTNYPATKKQVSITLFRLLPTVIVPSYHFFVILRKKTTLTFPRTVRRRD